MLACSVIGLIYRMHYQQTLKHVYLAPKMCAETFLAMNEELVAIACRLQSPHRFLCIAFERRWKKRCLVIHKSQLKITFLKRETGIYFNGAIKHWHEKLLNEDRDMKQTPTDSGSERRHTFPVCSQREILWDVSPR